VSKVKSVLVRWPGGGVALGLGGGVRLDNEYFHNSDVEHLGKASRVRLAESRKVMTVIDVAALNACIFWANTKKLLAL
jgi:hypothetical protein